MPEAEVNGVRLFYEEHGEGPPILCIHGVGSSALAWSSALPALARLGRVIAYDRRGHTRSPLPDRAAATAVAEHTADAAALLDELSASPAAVIGRSYGGGVALELAVRFPDRVRALVLLDGDAPLELSPAYARWLERLTRQVSEAETRDGIDAVGRALTDAAIGTEAWDSFPEAIRRMFTDNGPAILADLRGEWLQIDAAALESLPIPALVVTAADSPPEFRELAEATARALPDSRLTEVPGGHMIDPASSEVVSFLEEVLGGGR
jgi:pimeloyl-ACP methyl ester carboxylesterase